MGPFGACTPDSHVRAPGTNIVLTKPFEPDERKDLLKRDHPVVEHRSVPHPAKSGATPGGVEPGPLTEPTREASCVSMTLTLFLCRNHRISFIDRPPIVLAWRVQVGHGDVELVSSRTLGRDVHLAILLLAFLYPPIHQPYAEDRGRPARQRKGTRLLA